jgi:serine phosphatase RsbU (regulator of sigma subunit)
MKKLRELLEQMSTTPFEMQEQQLNKAFEQWKGRNEQVDDVCVLGLKF